MSNRLDILIFGATGYTGQYLVEEMARKAQQLSIRWGVAGRTKNKLNDVLQQASTVTGIADLSSTVDTVVANITDRQSLIEMCQRTKILIDCVGPVGVTDKEGCRGASDTLFSTVSTENQSFRRVSKRVRIIWTFVVNPK